MAIKRTIEEFIKDSNKIHSNKYDYSKSIYTNNKCKLIIICPIHGEFLQTPNDHLSGKGCKKCQYDKLKENKKYTKEKFIKIANILHKNKYNYSLINYKNSLTKIKILCPIHGEFLQTPSSHLSGNGCRLCQYEIFGNVRRKKLKDFIKQAKIIHGDKYDYSGCVYKNRKTLISIKCKKHGYFKQTPADHLKKHGCPKCNESKGEKQIENLLIERKIHFVKQKTFPDCKHKRLLKFDFFLPHHNIIIEYDGEQHYSPIKSWGGEKNLKNIKKRDSIKNLWCANNNIKIIRIRYDENIIDKLSLSF